jgi:hypothetical protein
MNPERKQSLKRERRRERKRETGSGNGDAFVERKSGASSRTIVSDGRTGPHIAHAFCCSAHTVLYH